MRLMVLIVAAFGFFASTGAVAAIDCSRAKSNIDKLICSSSKLGLAQEQMAYSFRQAVNRGVDPVMLRRSQRQWHDQVRDACNDVPCLLKAFDERGAELDNY